MTFDQSRAELLGTVTRFIMLGTMSTPVGASEQAGRALDFQSAHTYLGRPWADSIVGCESIVDALERAACRWPNWPVMTEAAHGIVGRSITYGTAQAKSMRASTALRRNCDLRSGQNVALVMQNSIAHLITLIGALATGACVVLLSPLDPPKRQAMQFRAAGCTLELVVDEAHANRPWPTVDVPRLVDRRATTDAMPPVEPRSPALIIGTTGTTGASKLVIQSHYGIMVNCVATSRHHRLHPGDVLLGCLPTSHVNGLHFTLLSVICAGGHVVMCKQFDPGEYTRLAHAVRPRIASVVPSILNALVDRPAMAAFSSLDYFVTAAAPLSSSTVVAVRERLGKRVVQGYGLTETMNFSTTMPMRLSDQEYRACMETSDLPPVGVALYGTEVAIIRDDGTPAAMEEFGEICMRGHSLMSGYLGDPEASAEAFAHGWFHSGDSGWMQEIVRGQHAFFVGGRRKNVVKIGGHGVSLEEVDRALVSISGVVDAAAFAVPDPVLGEAIEASVVAGDRSLTAREIKRILAESLPRPGIPVAVHFCAGLPRTATGKINRETLRELFRLDPASQEP